MAEVVVVLALYGLFRAGLDLDSYFLVFFRHLVWRRGFNVGLRGALSKFSRQ